LIDLDNISPELFKELMGFVLTAGLNFRKLDQKTESGTGRTLFVELASKAEEKALTGVLTKLGLPEQITIGTSNKASLGGKKLGIFGLDNSNNAKYIDKTTGKRFSIVGEK
jgi:hypothetical protein